MKAALLSSSISQIEFASQSPPDPMSMTVKFTSCYCNGVAIIYHLIGINPFGYPLAAKHSRPLFVFRFFGFFHQLFYRRQSINWKISVRRNIVGACNVVRVPVCKNDARNRFSKLSAFCLSALLSLIVKVVSTMMSSLICFYNKGVHLQHWLA